MADNNNSQTDYYAPTESYYDQVHRTTWARRTSGFLAGGTIGVVVGAAIGLAASFLPVAMSTLGIASVVASAPALAAIGSTVALFAGVGAFLGMAITADVTANASSSAAGLDEKERRDHMGKSSLQEVTPHASLKEEIADGLKKKGPPLFSWKVAAVTVPLFAAFGAIMACHPFTAALVMDKAFPALTTLGAKVIASGAIFGMFGATIGLKMSMITNKVSNFYYKLITEQYFQKSKEPEVAVAKSQASAVAVEEPAMLIEQKPEKSFAASHTRFSIKGMIEHHESGAPTQETGITR